jgi:tetratricopeptide (TPR) repeat protein
MMEVKAWKEKTIIPTYKTGEPDKNPMFLEKRVYQGSSGVVYPYQVIDKVYDEKEDKAWTALYLENDYIKVMILPELGGRIQMAYDKTNDYHFVYYNRVIKPALVGLTGPWISGGIEFNWPQHHRPTTFDATDYYISENSDGSKTVWVNEYEMMFGTKCALGFTLYPDKAYIELQARLYNRTPFPQTFLWWANPAVSVDEHYQSVFPPDVHAVFDHGKRDVSSFPIATGTYYKVDYSPGTDISVYTNIPVPTSYMAVNSQFDFVGGYHHQKKAGLMHIANHHTSPGKKQWTWGCGDFGKAWDKQLTDEDGPYFELMCGMYTDNQPDFGWIMPNEAREFKQYFMPYKNIGYVKNASKEAMVNMEFSEHQIKIHVYTTSEQAVIIRLYNNGNIIFEDKATLSPVNTYHNTIPIPAADTSQFRLVVSDLSGKELIAYTPVTRQGAPLPDPARPIALPGEIETPEALFLAGHHLEQYRHATYNPIDYYNEGLKRDSTDIRCNNAKGLWLLRRGAFQEAEIYLRKAVEKINRHNPNPYDSEPLYNLGLCLKYQKQYDEAYNLFFKSSWSAAQQDVAYLQAAYIDARRAQWQIVLELSDKSLLRNYNSLRARHLKIIALRKIGRPEEALELCHQTLDTDAFDFGALYELALCYYQKDQHALADDTVSRLQEMIRQRAYTYIEIANQYAEACLWEEAISFLQLYKGNDALITYYIGYYELQAGRSKQAGEHFDLALNQEVTGSFINRIEDVLVLETAATFNAHDYKAWYHLGNYYYAKQLYNEAGAAWERSIAINANFPTTLRNLGIASFNKFNKRQEALDLYEQAFAADESDARILFELDQLKKRFNISPHKRLAFLERYTELIYQRDDLLIELINLHTLTGNTIKALEMIERHQFHPWEGGEGKVSTQYITNLVLQSRNALLNNNSTAAISLLNRTRVYPNNLGEGKIFGAQENDIFYWLGCAYDQQGDAAKAYEHWEAAAVGLDEPAPAIFYNDQQPDKIYYQGLALKKLGKTTEAMQKFQKLIDYARTHENDHIRIDFFAVSLPDLMIFDDDLDTKNKIHCYYLAGLGHLGLGNFSEAKQYLDKVIDMDPGHLGAIIHLAQQEPAHL